MAFCIYCGAQNTSDAVFCLLCGQILYHEPRSRVQPKKQLWRQHRLLLGTFLFVTLAVLAVVFSIRKSADVKRDAPQLTTGSRTRTTSLGAPVLTIIASNRVGMPISQGSGFILSSDGLAGSNYHVIKGATEAIAECCNGRVFEIHSVEGADLERDLVVFQLYERGSVDRPQNLPYVTLGSSKDLSVGDKVITVGSPQGLENTISDGILSAVREYKSVRYLQITAPISPGSSGGPVLNESGRMVGIATFQFEKGQNLNFAVDAEHIRPLLDQRFGVSLAEFQSAVRSIQRQQSSVRAPVANNTPAPPPGRPAVAATPTLSLSELVNEASGRYRLDPDLVNSVILVGSGFNPNAVSPRGAQGLMQLMPGTAAQLGASNAFDPQANVEGGTRYLRELLERYNFDLVKALAAYYAGPELVDQYGGVPPDYETRAYVGSIVRDFNRKKIVQQKAARPPQ